MMKSINLRSAFAASLLLSLLLPAIAFAGEKFDYTFKLTKIDWTDPQQPIGVFSFRNNSSATFKITASDIDAVVAPQYPRLDAKVGGDWKEIEVAGGCVGMPDHVPLAPGKTYTVKIPLAPLLGRASEACATIFCDAPGKQQKEFFLSTPFRVTKQRSES